MIRRARPWLAPVIALALCAAQLGMTVHASTHLWADPEQGIAQLCDYCLTSSSLQDMADDAAALPVVAQVARQSPPQAVARHDAPQRAFNGFRSRAPPVLL